jgi:drug/metabolite transporter (DMT)-like permease
LREGAAAVSARSTQIPFVPVTFLLLWCTGFIVAKYAAPHAPPLTFLLWRFAGVVLVVLPVTVLTRARWPSSVRLWLHIAMAGVLLQAAYLGGVWWVIDRGMPAGVAALIVGVQPLATGVLAGLIGERATGRQWVGLLLGFVGVGLVLSDRLTLQGITTEVIAVNLGALAGITLGTLYQKRFCGGTDLRTGTAIQFGAAFVVVLPFALLLESRQVAFTTEFWLALAWSVVVLSLVAMMLLLGMIRRGRATEVAGLMYLTPPMTSVFAWWLFDERIGVLAWLGVGVTMLGVALVLRRTT